MNALILVDIQNDFLPGGPLGVPDGEAVIEPSNRLMDQVDLVVATQDWHPPGHGSFAANHPGRSAFDQIELNGLPQTLWPTHCEQGTSGAEFAPGLKIDRAEAIFRKGTDPAIDSYSGFFDNGHRRCTGLAGYLSARRIDQVVIVGLATDYCVKFTALDAAEAGFRVLVVKEACRGVDLNDGDVDAAFEEMATSGVELVRKVDEV